MARPDLRPMTEADVGPAAALLERGDWGPVEARSAFFTFAVRQPNCDSLVADLDGELVGTGVGTANGSAGWVGTIFVDAAHRGGGLGRALTEAVIDRLESRGCSTLVLVATTLGRPIYDRLGFDVQSWYVIHEAPGIDGGDDRTAGRIRPVTTSDLDAMAALDLTATGEDRSDMLAALVGTSDDAGWTLRAPDGDLDGFVLRPPWGGGATIARTFDAATSILRHRRERAGPDRRVRAGVLAENVAGIDWLKASGWSEAWRAVRMARGAPLDLRPEMIWGQFNFALG